MSTLKNTPLSEWHAANGAKMAEFAGWNMPIQYPTGIINEHKHTREQAGIFDISHMGEFLVKGKNAFKSLSKILSHNLTTLKNERCRYGFLLNENGGVLDDLIVYRKSENDFFLVVNAARIENDFNWIKQHLDAETTIENVSDKTAKIDLQGPRSLDVLEMTLNQNFKLLPYFGFVELNFAGIDLLISRTGYTGELGYELYVPSDKVLKLWELLLKNPTVKPIGLGARDTLRLEAGLPLYGQDLDEKHTPAEAGYMAMLTSPENYIGKENAIKINEQLVALSIEGRRSARHDDVVCLNGTDKVVGRVTSASFAPSLGQSIALAYIKKEFADNKEFSIQAAKTILNAKVTNLPFYSGTARIKL
ncbi:glycine cleavage system aminomethyltransferase GcvT [Desulfovibrio litoralis]|uniref:aminomethyltransferase n=1 Tax=Desulfovibrio litoralis DSM 11393 TaxID=1121455 RepID=A0A1M7SWZ6_9BACT|nr:glycine cleavage system aminomethyltransferase GcvT [Desulfovibrio litoralis]SHN63045.1 aminomethyltransferase [Desulfovibrio litoralis DSM 11393]